MESKSCARCGATKALEDFNREARSKDGRGSYCRECSRAYSRQYHLDNAERLNARDRTKRRTDPHQREVARAWGRSWYAANRERVAAKRAANAEALAAYKKRYRDANRQAISESLSEYRQRNAEKIAAYRAEYRLKNRESVLEALREWRVANPEKALQYTHRRRARMREAGVEPVDVAALWTGVCGICGGKMDKELRRPDPMSKSLDHIVPIARGGSHTQDNLQWAHLVCNMRKGARTS